MEYQELKEYYRTLVTCHSELCWMFEKDIAEPQVRNLVKTFREEMQRVEEELDKKDAEIEKNVRNVAASMSFSGFHVTEEETETGRKIMRGELKSEDVIAEIKKKYMVKFQTMITAEMVQTLDDRALKWYRKHITRFHQECLRFDKCYCGDPENVFHDHFKGIEKLLSDEIERRKQYYKEHGVL